MWSFGSDDDDDLAAVADWLGVPPESGAVNQELGRLDETIEQIARAVDCDPTATQSSVELLDEIERAVRQRSVSDSPSSGRDDASRGDRGTESARDGHDTDSARGDHSSDPSRREPGGTTGDAGAGGGATTGGRGGGKPGEPDETDEPPAAQAARETRRRLDSPSQEMAVLLDRLEDGSQQATVDALTTVAETVAVGNSAEPFQRDRSAIEQQLNQASRTVERELSGTVGSRLRERLESLDGQLDRVDDSNPVVPYAVHSEVSFYNNRLLDALVMADSGADERRADDGAADTAGGGSSDSARSDSPTTTGEPADAGTEAGGPDAASAVEPDVSAVRDRRREITQQYVNGREDHSHTIPLLFLSTADSLAESAEEAVAAGDPETAAGIATAATELLDTVEQLYRKNEYSVMLRRLRG